VKTGSEADLVLLRHMLGCIDNIDADTQRRRAVFFGSRTVRDAVLRNLQLLTESSQRLSAAVKDAEPGVPWRQLSGTRNILVHAYLGGIDEETVWETVDRDLPPLRAALVRMLARLGAAP
jgi:uncharacterized protein with HEPN domain